MAIAIARRMQPPVKIFAAHLRRELGWSSLSRQTVYQWESGHSRVPAAVLLAASKATGQSVDELLRAARRQIDLGLAAGE